MCFPYRSTLQVSYEPTTLNSEQELRELGLRKGISTATETHATWSLNFTSWDSFIFFFQMATVIPDVRQFLLFLELKHSLQTILHFQCV